jgi:DNA polymerase III subunit chi
MTRVDFYLLANPSQKERETAVCKLTHKAFRLGHRIYILAPDSEQAARLDRMLWTFAAASFVPHALNLDKAGSQLPVVIGQDSPPSDFEDVLISLADEVPDCFSRFQRIAEVVGDTETDKRRARERFRFYRDRGYPLQTHNL